MLVQEIKNAKMDAYQSIQQRFKYGDRLRAVARRATEVFEEIKFAVECLGGDDDSELLEQALEKVRRLAIYAFAASKWIDNEAKELTTRSLKLPGSAKYQEFNKVNMKKKKADASSKYGQGIASLPTPILEADTIGIEEEFFSNHLKFVKHWQEKEKLSQSTVQYLTQSTITYPLVNLFAIELMTKILKINQKIL
ncbi:hypothetical protein G6F70_007940 [Rhizopus microsporus]|nr:hypothetical protein G6F71_003698 [Rhizopus microsporus]KAG1195819.1 hypothetical protein G6F70_007940 [Rhizopus microsporus]KAG1212821.1 hypothetical protein G6F69_003384 [Rhizopus microsporus]KAG1233991.1 hypothetical protein G6F67_003881 [Rhizopus microsporus]KAG1260513.1 hypothetical protein G6F68_007389 [Rhizopus microsporus]